MGVVAGAGGAEAGVSARIDFSKAVDQCDSPGPWPPVDRGIDAELGEIERGRLQRQRDIDGGMALVDRNADVNAGRDARAQAGYAAPGLTPVANKIALRAGPGLDSVGLPPGPETRCVGGFGGTATRRIVPQSAGETICRLISKTFQEITAEIGHGRACRQIRIDRSRRRGWRRGDRLRLAGRGSCNSGHESERYRNHEPATGPGLLCSRKPR